VSQATRPLQNRVDPFGELHANSSRGLFMGNRGGRFHNHDRTLGARRHVSRRWIACVCAFKGRHRDVWGKSYTELFFLDEPTALAAGHRPCFECRRVDALRFAERFPHEGGRPGVDAMDRILHAQRLDGAHKRLHRRPLDALPDGAMIAEMNECFAIRGTQLLPWSFDGYGAPLGRPSGLANVLTPPSILSVLAAGYIPLWHPSVG
jgi:hypothetical protein